MTPEQQLCLSIVAKNVRCIRAWCRSANASIATTTRAIDAILWLRGESPSDSLCFELACDVLGQDVAAAREAITKRFKAEWPEEYVALCLLADAFVASERERHAKTTAKRCVKYALVIVS